MKKRIVICLSVVVVLASGIVLAVTNSSRTAGDFFEANLEQLADGELCPGEEENCITGGERCLYHYDGKNYNIETKKNIKDESSTKSKKR